MLIIRRVLFPTDFSECSKLALLHAVKVAQRYRSELHILHATVLHDHHPEDPAHRLPDLSEIERILEGFALERMDSMVTEEDSSGLVLRRVHRRGVAAAPLIVEYAVEEGIDLIVMGTHGRRGVRKLLMGSVAAEVMRMAPCSVLTVRGKGEDVFSPKIRRILAPVDFSEHGKEALGVACSLANSYDADLHLLHVLPQIANRAFCDMGGMGIPDLVRDLPRRTESDLRDFLEEKCSQSGTTAEYHVLEGQPGPALARFSKDHGIDLIIMATHGLSGIMHFLMGSTTEKVLAGAECPVLVVGGGRRTLLTEGA